MYTHTHTLQINLQNCNLKKYNFHNGSGKIASKWYTRLFKNGSINTNKPVLSY